MFCILSDFNYNSRHMIEARKRPPNASTVTSAVVGDPVDSQLRVHNNGFEALI